MPNESSINDFGLLIAYIVPGFAALWGAAYFSEPVRTWVSVPSADAPTVGGFLYMTVASIATGLTLSTIRWMVLDPVHHRTGIRPPRWDISNLQRNLQAFSLLVDSHYRYYQAYGNGLVALAPVYLARRSSVGFVAGAIGWEDAAFLLVAIVLFHGSRDTLRKYYRRTEQLLVDGKNRRKR